MTAPVVGVQYKPLENGKYALRYVAAIDSLSVTAVWTRDICEASGTRRNQSASRQVTVDKAYSALSSDGGVVTPADFNLNAKYFVVYTLRNIPDTDLNSYLFAYLTLSDGSSTVKSQARISRVSGGDTFTIDTDSRHGYFLHGNIDGKEFVDVNDNGGTDNFIQESGISMNAEDEFGVFKYEPGTGEQHTGEHFQCFGTFGSGTNFFKVNSSNGLPKMFNNGSYNIFISKKSGTENVVYFTGTVSAERIYLDAVNWNPSAVRLVAYAFKEWGSGDSYGKNEHFYLMDVCEDSNVFKVDIDISLYEKVIFCRADKNGDIAWNIIYNQSYDLALPSTSAVNRKYRITAWEGNGEQHCPGTWDPVW